MDNDKMTPDPSAENNLTGTDNESEKLLNDGVENLAENKSENSDHQFRETETKEIEVEEKNDDNQISAESDTAHDVNASASDTRDSAASHDNGIAGAESGADADAGSSAVEEVADEANTEAAAGDETELEAEAQPQQPETVLDGAPQLADDTTVTEAVAEDKTNAENVAKPEAETQSQQSEAVIDESYFIETEPAEHGKTADESSRTVESANEEPESDVTIAFPEQSQPEEKAEATPEENVVSAGPEKISEKESEPTETETTGEKDNLFSNLLKRFNIQSAASAASDEQAQPEQQATAETQQDKSYKLSELSLAEQQDEPTPDDPGTSSQVSPKSEDPEDYVRKISVSLATKSHREEDAAIKNKEYAQKISKSLAAQELNENAAAPTPQPVQAPSVAPQPAPVITPQAGNLGGIPYQYNVPVAPSYPYHKAEPPTQSRRNEKSFAYLLFVILLAAMTLFTVFTYLLLSSNKSADNVSGGPDDPDITEPAKLEVFSWEENGLLYLSIDGTEIIVVNRDNKLPSDYGDGVDPEAKAAYDGMLQAAAGDGVYIYTAADYLDYYSQDLRYNRYANYHGEDIVDRFMQKAGYSENQLGVAFHVNCAEADYMYSEAFAQTPEYNWLIQNAAEYGFILRYPEGKESQTGYSFSPWHFRYVGVDLAKLMAESGMVIEEYLDIAEPLPEAA